MDKTPDGLGMPPIPQLNDCWNQIGIRGDAESVFDAHNAYLLATWSDQADFRYSNALVDAGLSADGASYVVL